MARTANGDYGSKQGQGYKSSRDDEIKSLKARLAIVENSGKVETEPTEDPQAMFAALRSTLETIAANEVNSPTSETHYTNAPRNIIDSGASMTFVRDLESVTNPIKHVRSLVTAEGNSTKSTHSGKLQITQGSQPVFVSALVVPIFKDNLISVEKMTKGHNVVFTSEGAYLLDKTKANTSAKLIGGRGSDNLYTLSEENAIGTSSLHAAPAKLLLPSKIPLHETLNHSNPKTIHEFKKLYPKAAAYILNSLNKEQRKKVRVVSRA